MITGKDILFLKAVDFLILSRRNEPSMGRKVEKKPIALDSLLGFLVSFASAFLQEVKMSWPSTKVEIEVEEND